MSPRSIQLLARYGATAFLAITTWLGVEVEQGRVESIMIPVATGVVALVGILADHYIHRLRNRVALPDE